MFNPRYEITPKLLKKVKEIAIKTNDLNQQVVPKIIYARLEKVARVVSSFASNKIEGNPLSLTEVKHLLRNKPEFISNSQREILNYNQVLEELNALVTQQQCTLTPERVLAIHRGVTQGVLPSHQSGAWRREPVVVNNPVTGQVVYLPPNYSEVPFLIQELLEFVAIHQKEFDPVIMAGLFHRQLVIIHPFIDGNGRTTRLVTKLLLAALGLNTFNLFSFENYYNQNISRYFAHVGVQGDYYEQVVNLDFTEWLEYFATGIADELERVSLQLHQATITPDQALKLHDRVLLQYISINGWITDRKYAQLVDRARATRALDLQRLVAQKVLRRKGKGRATYYQLHPQVTDWEESLY